jgi:hypothetical protein
MTRMLSTSLALTMLLATSSAMAVPQQTHESALTSLKKSVATGVADYKERRAAAGPGFFKRTMLKTGAMLHTAKVNTVAFLDKTGHNITAATKATGNAIAIGFRETKAGASQLGLAMKDKSIEIADGTKAIGAKIATDTKAIGTKIATDTKAIGTKIASDTARVANATKMGYSAMRASHQERVAQRKAYKAADKDFNSWLNEKGNEDAKTFYRGAAKDAGLTSTKVVKGMNTTSAVMSSVAAVSNPLWLAPAALNVGLANEMGKKLTADKRTVAERTINMFMDKVPAERLESWSKASYIDPELAK